jgi:hypothetical protein
VQDIQRELNVIEHKPCRFRKQDISVHHDTDSQKFILYD